MEPKGYAILGGAADINAQDDLAFRFVCEHGNLDVIDYLVNNGANIHAKNNQALDWASKHGNTHIVKYLEDYIEKKKEIEELQKQLIDIQNKLNVLMKTQ
jgi:ankyrin repeat protein